MTRNQLGVMVAACAGLVPVAVASVTAQTIARFEDATSAAGITFSAHATGGYPDEFPPMQPHIGTGVAVGDYDDDGDPDIFLCDTDGHTGVLYRNRGDGTYEDVTSAAGITDLGLSRSAMFVDIGGDRHLDLVIFNESEGEPGFPGSRLYENDGDGTFTDRTAGSGFVPQHVVFGGATAGDYDRDGDLDLYLVSWIDLRRFLYRNDGSFTFTDVTVSAGLFVDPGDVDAVQQWSPVFVDMDNDGWQDIFCAVDFDVDYCFRNDHDGTFSPLEQVLPREYHVGNDMGVAPGDLDRDGDIDLYTTNVTEDFDDPPCCNWLYVNQGDGQLTNEAGPRGAYDTGWGWGTVFFDAELDGDLDLAAVNGWRIDQPEYKGPPVLLINDGDGVFTEEGATAGLTHAESSRGLVAFDHDLDGDLDLIMTDLDGPATLYRNITPRGDRHWLVVRLVGMTSNSHGVGARVYARTGSDVQMHEIVAGGSFFAGVPLEARFGLGTHDTVDELRVVWPGGEEQLDTNIAADQVVVWTEGTTPIEEAPGLPASGGPGALRVLARPNPFSGAMALDVRVPGGAAVSVTILDAAGRRVRELHSPGGAPDRVIRWDGRGASGLAVPAGVYFVRVSSGADGRKVVRRLTRIR